MPIGMATDPQAAMGAQAPAMATAAPQGAGFMASPQAGLPQMAPGNPQTTMMLGQIAAKLLQKQQGTKYAIDLSRHLRTIVQKLLASGVLENPQAESDLAAIIQKFASFADKLGKTGPSQSPELTNSLAQMVGTGGSGVAA